jgi:hypothetical protein
MGLRRSAWLKVRRHVCHQNGLHEDNDLAIHLNQAGLAVGYQNRLQVLVSVRRAANGPRAAWRYAFAEHRTYAHHGVTRLRTIVAGLILLMVYPGLKLTYRWYDPHQKRFSWHKLLHNRSVARPNPMDLG